MFLLLQTISVPENFDPRTWPAGWVIVGFLALLWLLKQLAETVTSVRTIRDGSLSMWGWLKAIFTSARHQAALERAEIKKGLETVTASCAGSDAKISEVLKEVKPNGGKSLRDEVATIAGKVDDTAAWIRHQKETSTTPIFILDDEGKMYFANAAFRELVGAEESDLMFRNYLSRMEAGDRKRFIDELHVAIDNKIPFDTVVHFKREGPRYQPVRMQATPNVAHGGKLRRFFGTATRIDSTEVIHESQA